MCVTSTQHNFIALGQAGGHVDVLKLRGEQRNQGMIVSSILISQAGYINKICLSHSQSSLILACEHGIYFLDMDATKKNLNLSQERYLNSTLISQVLEYQYGKLIAAVYNKSGYFLIDRGTH